jgi:hypothetical protein
MSLYDKASLVQIPSGYKAGKLYSVIPNTSAGDFTVSGDAEGEATRINKNGLIESVAANVARLNYDPTNPQDPHLLLEPSRTNSLPESENFSTNWIAIGSTVSGGVSSPDGGTNAYSLIEGTASGGKIIYDTISVSAGSVTYSLFMKKGDKRYTALLLSGVVTTSMFNVDLENGTGTTATGSFDSTNIEQYPNGWYRISVTATATAGNLNCNVYLMNGSTYNDRNYTGNGTDKTYIFGAQLEAGSYPTSYIPTSGSAVTRTQDDCILTGFSSNLGQTEGVLFIDMDNFGQAGTSYGNFLKIYEDGDSTDKVIIQNSAEAANRIIFVVRANSSTLFQPREDIPTGRNKIALKYKSGDIDVFLNGTKIETSSSTFTFANTLNKVQIGQPNKVYQVMIFNEALSDAELIELTS